MLGDEFKGYVFKIAGGFDKDGFAMKQGVFTNTRIRLLLSPGSKGYRATRSGERKRRSIRGCIVGPDISMLSLILVKKGDAEIPGLTDTTKPRRLGPKRATNIRKLFGIEKREGQNASDDNALIKKSAIRRTFKSKKNPEAPLRHKAPKIQRLVTDQRLRRKKIVAQETVNRWKKTQQASTEYQKLYDAWIKKKSYDFQQARRAERIAKDAPK